MRMSMFQDIWLRSSDLFSPRLTKLKSGGLPWLLLDQKTAPARRSRSAAGMTSRRDIGLLSSARGGGARRRAAVAGDPLLHGIFERAAALLEFIGGGIRGDAGHHGMRRVSERRVVAGGGDLLQGVGAVALE